MPGYAPRPGSTCPSVDAVRRPVTVAGTPLGALEAEVWAPADAAPEEPLPLLLAHDGPEMDKFAGLTHYVGALIGDGRLPRMRVALLVPGARNRTYSANPAYAAALTDHVLPRLLEVFPTDRPPGAERAEPGRAGGAARRLDVAGHVRRAAAPVRLVLHPRAGPAGVGLRVLEARSPASSARCTPRPRPPRARRR